MSLSGNPPTPTSQPQHQQTQRITRQSQLQVPPSTDSRASSSSSSTTAHTDIGINPGIHHIPPTPQRAQLPPIHIPELDSRQFTTRNQYQSYPQRPHPLHQSLSSPLLPISGPGTGSADPYTGTRHLPHPLSSPGAGQLYPPGTQYFHPLASSTSSSPLSIDSRVLRSPHPPLTAILHPSAAYQSQSHFQQQQHQLLRQQQQQQQLLHQQSLQLPRPVSRERPVIQSRPYHTISPLFDHPASSPYTTAPPHLPPLSSHLTRSSPVQIPPPLRFHYSATPPEGFPSHHQLLNSNPNDRSRPSSAQSHTSTTSQPLTHAQTRSQHFPEFLIPAMPPRRKPAADTVTMSGTPQTISSTTSSARPRKGAKGNGWTMEHTYDSVGHKKEVIVIDDSQTPEHPPRKRTRAQVAAENAAIESGRGHAYGHGHGQNGHLYNGASAHSVANTSSAGKKRKVDEGTDSASKKKGKAAVSVFRQISR